jgi:arginine/ornithine N-succinyltransferase beta subunit
MTTTLVLEPTNDADLHLLLSLAQRLGVKATALPAVKISLEERERRFMALFGSWQSDETGDEINQMLRESRQSNRPDIEL